MGNQPWTVLDSGDVDGDVDGVAQTSLRVTSKGWGRGGGLVKNIDLGEV